MYFPMTLRFLLLLFSSFLSTPTTNNIPLSTYFISLCLGPSHGLQTSTLYQRSPRSQSTSRWNGKTSSAFVRSNKIPSRHRREVQQSTPTTTRVCLWYSVQRTETGFVISCRRHPRTEPRSELLRHPAACTYSDQTPSTANHQAAVLITSVASSRRIVKKRTRQKLARTQKDSLWALCRNTPVREGPVFPIPAAVHRHGMPLHQKKEKKRKKREETRSIVVAATDFTPTGPQKGSPPKPPRRTEYSGRRYATYMQATLGIFPVPVPDPRHGGTGQHSHFVAAAVAGRSIRCSQNLPSF